MKVAYSWLKEYADFTQTAEEISLLLTDCGLEVESVESFESIRGGLRGVVVGEVKTCVKHPDADKLSLTTVDVGASELLTIVCGAPNVAAGQKVAVATIGTRLYSGEEAFEIKKSKIRGQLSEGMICAEDELGLGKGHEGILVLDPSTPVGTSAAEYFKVTTDTLFEIGLTPNRNDATSHLGVARDLVALLRTRQGLPLSLKYPDLSGFSVDIRSQPILVSVENPHDCPRYSSLVLRNITVKESPAWLKNRLQSVGLRPINNVVDITNFILMEYGQPLHAFDADKIVGGQVIVKNLPQGSVFKTLDGVERKLNGSELMICNAQEGMCMAGIFGGEKSGVSEGTRHLFLESAYFHPVSIRKSSKAHGLKTDASFRYERGGDPNITVDALKRAALLIRELAGGEIASDIQDVYPQPIVPICVDLHFDHLSDIVGHSIPAQEVVDILRALEMRVDWADNSPFCRVEIPTNKADVTREIDLIEEVLRIYGYNRIPRQGKAFLPYANETKPEKEKIYRRIADYLSANGFSEIMNNSFTKAEYTTSVAGFDAALNVSIANPLSNELDVMRQSLLFGGLTSIAYNCNHQIPDLKLYEFGFTYQQNPKYDASAAVTKRFLENQRLALFLTGMQESESWQNKAEEVSFYALKSAVNRIFQSLRKTNYKVESTLPEYFAEGMSYAINGKTVATFGRLAKSCLKIFDIKQDVYYADIAWSDLLKSLSTQAIVATEIAKFPAVRRDLSLLLDLSVRFADIEQVAFESEKKLLTKVDLFDVYEGNKLPAGKKSYALSFFLQDPEKTLSEKQISGVMDKLIRRFQDQWGATLR